MKEAIRGDQRRSEAIGGDQRRSEAIRGDQRQSEESKSIERRDTSVLASTPVLSSVGSKYMVSLAIAVVPLEEEWLSWAEGGAVPLCARAQIAKIASAAATTVYADTSKVT